MHAYYAKYSLTMMFRPNGHSVLPLVNHCRYEVGTNQIKICVLRVWKELRAACCREKDY